MVLVRVRYKTLPMVARCFLALGLSIFAFPTQGDSINDALRAEIQKRYELEKDLFHTREALREEMDNPPISREAKSFQVTIFAASIVVWGSLSRLIELPTEIAYTIEIADIVDSIENGNTSDIVTDLLEKIVAPQIDAARSAASYVNRTWAEYRTEREEHERTVLKLAKEVDELYASIIEVQAGIDIIYYEYVLENESRERNADALMRERTSFTALMYGWSLNWGNQNTVGGEDASPPATTSPATPGQPIPPASSGPVTVPPPP